MVMTVTVLRPDYDRTNGGVSNKANKLLVIGARERQPANPIFPVMVLDQFVPGAACLRPLTAPKGSTGRVGPMAGGNYAVGDANFDDAVRTLLGHDFTGAVPIHDRFESQELADQLGH